MKDYEASEAAYKNGYDYGLLLKKWNQYPYGEQYIKGIRDALADALKECETDDRKRQADRVN